MIIEKSVQKEEVDYKVYEIKEMTTDADQKVNVKSLKRTVRKDEVEQRISQLDAEITRLQAEKKEEEEVLTEIEKLN